MAAASPAPAVRASARSPAPGAPGLGPAVTAALMVGLAACSSQGSGTTTTTTTTTTSTTTSTTMPAAVPGTSILRSRVAPLAPGEQVLPVEPQSSAAWLKMVPIAYRSFGAVPTFSSSPARTGRCPGGARPCCTFLVITATVFDLPDVGYSGSTTAPLSLAGLADMTAGLALTIGLSDPVVLGWGLGGQIALSLVERHPGFAASLILVDTSAGGLGAVALLKERDAPACPIERHPGCPLDASVPVHACGITSPIDLAEQPVRR